MAQDDDTVHYDGPADGFMCVSCASTKPGHPHPAEFHENGPKAALWELTTRTCTPEFFAEHMVTELRGWKDNFVRAIPERGKMEAAWTGMRLTAQIAAGLREGQVIGLASDGEDGVDRHVGGLTVTRSDLPGGCVGAYYPEMNPLIPLWYHDTLWKTPAAKGVPVRIVVPADAA